MLGKVIRGVIWKASDGIFFHLFPQDKAFIIDWSQVFVWVLLGGILDIDKYTKTASGKKNRLGQKKSIRAEKLPESIRAKKKALTKI